LIETFTVNYNLINRLLQLYNSSRQRIEFLLIKYPKNLLYYISRRKNMAQFLIFVYAL